MSLKSRANIKRLGLSGLAQGTSQHAFITRRMENIAEMHAKLRGLVSEEEMVAINAQLDPDDNNEKKEVL